MIKFKCTDCEHIADKKGFCPDCGKVLVEFEEKKETDAGNSKELDTLLGKIGEVVDKKVGDAMKEMETGKKEIFKAPASGQEKLEYTKGLLENSENTRDKSHFSGIIGEEKQKEFLQRAKIAFFFKYLVRFQISRDPADLEHVKALAEGVDADGGYLTPPEFRAQLVEELKDKPIMRNIVTVIPMASDSLELPTLTSSVQVSWGSENTAISTTTAVFNTLTFTPYRMNSLIYTSRELVADSAISIVPLLTRLFAQKVGEEEDRVIIQGSGSGQPTGLLSTTFQGIDNANVDANLPINIKKLPFRLGTAYRRNARWIMNSLSLAAVAALQDDNKQFLFKEGIEGLTPHRLAGYPVQEQNDMPLDTLLFGDFRQGYFLADRERMSVETTTEGAGTFEKHQVAIKVVERIDGQVAQSLAIRALTNAGID